MASVELFNYARTSFTIIFVTINFFRPSSASNINLQPKQNISSDAFAWSFRGDHSNSDHFKLLERDNEWLLVGARNTVYNLSMNTLTAQKSLEWPSTDKDMEQCVTKGQSEDDCHNYIRVLVKQSSGHLFVCGTNAYKPLCRQYSVTDDEEYQMQREFNGYAISPYDPRHNSTAIYIEATDEIYAGTVTDFTGDDPLIYRKPLSGKTTELRTQRNNLKCLNEPNFINAIDDEEAVYFFFRETALEYNMYGKAAYARVARVCKNDQGGGGHMYSDSWSSFLKARLNCSLPGNVPYYFDELQAMTDMTSGQYGFDDGGILYGVFTTPYNDLQSSAVCAFRMADIKRVFAQSAFKSQATPTSMWLPVSKRNVPATRPGNCAGDSRKLTDDVLNFVHTNALLYDAVPSLFGQPLFIDNNLRSKLTHIAVHAGVTAVDDRKYDVIFVGTNDGRVLKLVNVGDDNAVRTVLVETVKVFSNGQSVDNLLVYSPKRDEMSMDEKALSDGRLVVVSQDEVKALPLHFCSNQTTCGGCVRLQDPYCAWDVNAGKCVGRSDSFWHGNFKQAVASGVAPDCHGGDTGSEYFTINELYAQPSSGVTPAVYTAEGMAIAVVMTLAVAAVLGFIVGYRLSRWRASGFSEYSATSSTSSASSYGNHAHTRTPHLDYCPVANGVTSTKTGDVVLMMPEGKNEKNLVNFNTDTLPKDYRAKRVYL